MKRIEKEWEVFCASCFPPDLSKQQRIDLKRTFYGGMTGFIAILYKSTPDESEEDLLSSLQSELYIFNEDVKAGRA